MKKMLSILLVILFVLLPVNGFALTAEISSEQTNVACGDTVMLDIIYRDASVGAVRAAFTYDSTLLEYVGGEGSTAAGGQGTVVLLTSSAASTSLKTTMEFRAIHAGTAKFTLTTKEALSFDEKPLELPEAELTMKIQKAADSYVVVTANEATMHALCEPPYIPEGYGEKKIDIAGKSVTAACAGGSEYIYLTLPDETEGEYYLRREGVYYPVIEFAQESIILPFPQEEIPEGYRAETLRCRGMDISTCTDGAEYLVKITDRSGKARVCGIDPESGELMSSKKITLTDTQYVEIEAEYDYTLLYVLSGVLIVLLLAIIIAAVCKQKR